MANENVMELMGGLDPMDAPIAGEALTSSTESPQPFERAPLHTNEEDAIKDLFDRMTDGDKMDDLLHLLRIGAPVEDITQVVLFEGFRQGQYNPDMMLLLTEPTMFILLWMAEYAEIDPVLDPESDLDDDEGEGDVSSVLAGLNLSDVPEEITLASGQTITRPEALLAPQPTEES